jgi:hypothetical protein
MNGHVNAHSALCRAVVRFVQRHTLGKAAVAFRRYRRIKSSDTSAYICLNSAFDNRFNSRFGKEIHIGKGNYAVFEHFRNGNHRAEVNVCIAELILSGPDLFGKPAVKRQVFTVSAENGHRRMRVAVIKTGAKHFTRAIYCSVEAALGHFLAYLIDFFAVYGKKSIFKRRTVGKKYICIFEKDFHFLSPCIFDKI